MKLFEFQAKECFAQAGIPVPASVLIDDAGAVDAAVAAVALPCVLKAQVLVGGRGKAGLVRKAETLNEARDIAAALFSHPSGVRRVLVESAVDIDKEIYLAVTMDAARGCALMMGCAEGGVDIERAAIDTPDKIKREFIDLDRGVQPFQLSDFAYRLGLRGNEMKQIQKIAAALYRVFVKYDAELAEINPLFVAKDGSLIAGDGKLIIDDNSMARHPEYKKEREHFSSDMEYEAAQEGLPYLEFGGDISLMVAGAGLANTVYDLICYERGSVANYLEFGGPNYKKAETAMRICLENKPKVILIVTFGTIARADVMAEGIAQAVRTLKPSCPIVTCLRGTGEEKVREFFDPLGLTILNDTEDAVRLACAIAKGEAQ